MGSVAAYRRTRQPVSEGASWPTRLDSQRARAHFFNRHWHDIMAGQPPEIVEYLDAQREFADRVLGPGDGARSYRGVIEAGCVDGTLLMPVVIDRGLDYLGVDLATSAVVRARQAVDHRLATLALAGRGEGGTGVGTGVGDVRRTPPRRPRASVLAADIRDLATIAASRLPRRPRLAVFPFNVLGNIPTPQAAFRAARDCGSDILVFSYEISAAAAAVRRKYYQACGFTGVFHRNSQGVHFTAGLFTSSVYRPPLLREWLTEQGYTVDIGRFGTVGLAYHARLSGAAVTPE